ncbi:hypothetical protein P0D69_28145 [Paraburkholderia sediminicola]|uniref:hypothetical protein n=1 Tax=Paraburkholderia sediminicola TaxID=458836 RepID=UPI0038B6B973
MNKYVETSRTDFHVEKDVTGETITAVHRVDIGSSVEDALRMRQALEQTSSRNEEMRPVMEIPGILIEQYCLLKGVSWAEFWSSGENKKHIKALLMDPDLAAFRLRSAYKGQ